MQKEPKEDSHEATYCSINCLVCAVSLPASSLNFGLETVGTTSAGKTVNLTNVGSTVFSIATIGISGKNAADFAQTNTCPLAPATLAVNAHCIITVTFKPSAVGTRSAAVSVSDTNGSAQTVTLAGKGS